MCYIKSRSDVDYTNRQSNNIVQNLNSPPFCQTRSAEAFGLKLRIRNFSSKVLQFTVLLLLFVKR